jgi:hypothetical protein
LRSKTSATPHRSPTVLKDEATRTLILEATESNTLFEGLDLDTRLALIDVMTKKRVDAESDVIAQGAENDDARHFYVLEKGQMRHSSSKAATLSTASR